MSFEYTLLVVDDEKVIREGCARLLRPEGYRVLMASNGREALEVMASHPVNAVLCDLKMPVMGALEVLEETSKRYPDVPVIVITGHGTVESAVQCMQKGAYDFVTKPFRAEHLTLVTQRALEKQALERQARELERERARNLQDLAMEQSRVRTVVHCMADGVLVTNRNLEVVLCNPALLRLLGPTGPLEDAHSVSKCFNDGALVETLQALLARGEDEPEELVSQELTCGRSQLRALSTLIHGPGHEVLGTVTVLHDITRFKELDEMKSDFVHMVSHELRSPLSAIQQQHTVILDGLAGPLTEKQSELLERARDKIQGLLELINDLLDIAKIESGHALQQQVPMDLGRVLEEAAGLLTPKAEAHGVALKLDMPDEIPFVTADPRGMEEVFTNLITNAIHYSPGGGEVSVSVLARQGYLEVRVRDAGVGIDAQEIPRIFDKFYRVKHPETRKVIGTGLGLSLVKSIVEAHRGAIEVDSEPGKGSTFRVLLPAAGG